MASGIAIFLSLTCIRNKMPRNNSAPINKRANHSAMPQGKKVVSTILHPNCSREGIFEMPESKNTMPIQTDRMVKRIFDDVICKTLLN